MKRGTDQDLFGGRPNVGACRWCGNPLPVPKRRDSRFCDQRCRQASHRFAVQRCQLVATDRPMRFAYVDPPYPGKAHLYPEQTEVDHAELIRRVSLDYPDGWALSTSAEALRDVWSMCPPGTRCCVWVKAPRVVRTKRITSTWEALLVCGGRDRMSTSEAPQDALVYRGRHRSFPGALIGMKPPAFAEWMFRLLGAAEGDTLDDLYPGSGAIGEAWARFTGAEPASMKRVLAGRGDA